uniref:Putative secreted protein n=1 Tax=Ixodes ricinus TaxID=34613 RepID=A0A090XD16_IXORI
MSKPQETMIVLFFLGILCFCHSHAAFSQTKGGDNPDAEQVVVLLNRTYMFQSLQKISEVQCVYQIFYYVNVPRYGWKRKYDKVSLSTDGRSFLNYPRYVRKIVDSTIYLSSNPDFDMSPTELTILYSDLKSCMVTKGPNMRDFPNDCKLWLTDSSFGSPSPDCLNGFIRQCKFPPSNSTYNIAGCVDLDKHY